MARSGWTTHSPAPASSAPPLSHSLLRPLLPTHSLDPRSPRFRRPVVSGLAQLSPLHSLPCAFYSDFSSTSPFCHVVAPEGSTTRHNWLRKARRHLDQVRDSCSRLVPGTMLTLSPGTRFGGDSSPRTFPHFVLPIYSSHATHRPAPHEHVFLPATTPSVTFSSVIDPMSDIMSSPGGTSVRTFRTLEKPEKSRLGRVSTIDEGSG